MINLGLKQIFERQKSLGSPCYMEIFSVDDTKKKKNSIKIEHCNLDKLDFHDVFGKTETLNFGSQGVFINLNPLKAPKRNKQNIKKIQYVFIDLDDAQQDHNEIIKIALEKLNINYSYNCQSGNGFHFLIPIELEVINEPKIKGFLKYLKDNFCDKVDLATADTPRLFRVPESLHNKKGEFRLKTLYCKLPSQDIILKNNDIILNNQAQSIEKGFIDNKYLESINRDDKFFSSILNDSNKWDSYFKMLNEHDEQNQGKGTNKIFNKNLALFVYKNNSYYQKAFMFMKTWNNDYVTIKRFEHFFKRVSEPLSKDDINCSNNNVNYHELKKWSNLYGLILFMSLLEEQLRSSFLDDFEIYYLEDEKKESNYILYFPKSNYYVQKSFNEVIINIQYKCIDWGIDLEDKLNATSVDKWEELSYASKEKIICGLLLSKITKENRVKIVYNINYEPTNEKFVYMNNKKFFNTYNKTELWDHKEIKKNYDFPYIKDLIMNLCGDEQKNYDYFNKWLAWIIQKPTEKLPTAIILQGAQGSGKGTFKNCVLDQIFGNNCQEINQTQLEASFNDYLLGKQIMVANEVMHNENRQTLPNVLKNLVTDEYLTINIKFKKPIVARNYCHWIFCTNSENPIKLDVDDRRYSVFYSNKLNGGGRKAAEFVKTLKSNLDYELKEYISYLKSLEVDYYEVHEPIMTDAKLEIQNLNKDSVHKFLETLSQMDLDEAFHQFSTKANFDTLTIDCLTYLTTDLFYLLYQGYCELYGEVGKFNKQTFSKKLHRHKINNSVKYVSELKKNIRVICLKDLKTTLDKLLKVNKK